MELRIQEDGYGIYRCPGCEGFFVLDGWDEENDLCKLCMEGVEYVPEEDDDDCFICDHGAGCVCDERVDAYFEAQLDEELDSE